MSEQNEPPSLQARLRALAGEPWPFPSPDPCFDAAGNTMREAAAKLDELQRELKAERCLSLRNQVTDLERQLEEARKDAGRYQWLRSVPNGFEAKRIVNDTPEGMDAAIDSATAADGKSLGASPAATGQSAPALLASASVPGAESDQ